MAYRRGAARPRRHPNQRGADASRRGSPAQLAESFATEHHHAPRAYAKFMGADLASPNENAALALHAHGAVLDYLAAFDADALPPKANQNGGLQRLSGLKQGGPVRR